ncbi:acyl-CoA dehydrogenase [Geodermatophilus sp. TF02-6]|uniref:acyl-CoA dehydrogenase family protein n=1 Tax=Geodermatophilus sp. TF02-6 TaxID=2250575 RepID=UPI000DE889F1|nr:acyl-CoA dehydrogenase family protein [Geodermatophilus sp. TF02-6]RBY83684.1 acyl-CoA dehydrogenase [Geodermatophilus sp. TF02-6]
MDFSSNPLHEDIRRAVREMCAPFDDQYWMEHDISHEFPWEFYNAVAKAGWLGITIPEEYGGGGLGVTEAAIVEQEISATGGGMNACSAVHIGIFGFDPIIRHGSEELKQRFLPRVPSGDLHISFAVTEPDAGTDTSRITTFARKVPGGYRISGKKVWITKAQQAERMLLLCRTTKLADVAKKTDGMTLLFAEMDPEHVQIREIPKLGRNAVNTNELFIDDLFVADEDVVGEVDKGFRAILAGLNAERIISANAALGIGRAAVRRATTYAKERIVFDRPIGQNQGVAFPLAEALMRLDAADLMVTKAAWLLDNGLPCGREANMGKYLAADAAFFAADAALQTHGGFGFGKEYHVERYFREARLKRIAPISQEMVLNYLSEHVLGLPRSY